MHHEIVLLLLIKTILVDELECRPLQEKTQTVLLKILIPSKFLARVGPQTRREQGTALVVSGPADRRPASAPPGATPGDAGQRPAVPGYILKGGPQRRSNGWTPTAPDR